EERGVISFHEDAQSSIADLRQPLLFQLFRDRRQHRVVITLAQRKVKMDVEPIVEPLESFQALRQKLFPKFAIFEITSMQAGGLLAGQAGNVGMSVGQGFEL